MPYTRTDFTLAPVITQQSLYDTIKARFLACSGYTIFSEFTLTTDKCIVFELILDATKILGKVYLRIRIPTTLAVHQQLYTSWNTTSNTGTLASTESSAVTFSSNVAIEFLTFVKSPEYRFVILSQNTTFALLGIFRPENKPNTWSEDSYPYAFINDNNFTASNMFKTWFSASSNPYASTSAFTSNMADSRISSPNPINNRRDSLATLILYASTQGIAGQSSAEIITVAALGQTRFEDIIFTSGTEEYILLNPNYGAMALRRV